jgi:hypothetical protein
MESWLAWPGIIILAAGTLIPECRTRLYMVPASITIVYIFLNKYPWFARSMHSHKLTYEDLEDLNDIDLELRKRFQTVFTRIQQVGGALCAGLLVLYAFHIWHGDYNVFETLGVLGGILSIYARVFGYVGKFSIAFLHKLKKSATHTTTGREGAQTPFEHTNPNTDEPQKTEQHN